MSSLGVQVADKAMQWSPYIYSPEEVKRNDPNKKRRWLIPLVLAAQIAFKVGQFSSAAAGAHCMMPVDTCPAQDSMQTGFLLFPYGGACS